MHAQPAPSPSDAAPIVIWELTRACRLNCAHCAVGAQPRRSPLELSTYEAYKTIDQIVAMRPQELVMTGGDVLERSDLYQLLDYARRRGVRPTVSLSVTPSLTGAVVGKLRHNGAHRIALSIDSAAPESHDAFRKVSGQFASTLLALRWAKTAEIPLEVNTLIARRNIGELHRIAELVGDIGIDRWNLYFLVPTGSAKNIEMITSDEVEQAFEVIHGLSQQTGFRIRTFEAPQFRRFVMQRNAKAKRESLDRFFSKNGESMLPDEIRTAGVAADQVLFITHTGEVTVSPFVPLTAGNVRYQPLSLVHRSAELFAALRDPANLKGKCGRCEFRWLCGGSRARAFAMTGDLFAGDPLCAYQPGEFVSSAAVMAPTEA